MSRIFIAIAVIFLALSLLVAGACFLASRDTLAQFVPQGTSFYLHFNFNPLNSQGQAAAKYFNQNWPQKSLDQLLTSEWSFVKNYLNRDKIGQIDELAIAVVDNQPLILMRYKANYANFMPLVLNQNKTNNYYQFLTPTIFVASNQKTNLGKVNRQTNSWQNQFKNISLRSFVSGRLQSWTIKATLAKNGLNFYALNEQKVHKADLPEKINQFLAYVIAAPQNQEEYVYFLPNQSQTSLEQVQNIFQRRLALLFPIKKSKTLPDKTIINEIVADPSLFKFQNITIDGQNAYKLNIDKAKAVVFLGRFQNCILLSNDQVILEKFLKQPLQINFSEAFYWQNQAMVVQGQSANSQKYQGQNSVRGLIYFK
ncbi:MAG: hypothetical protein PHV78_00915 [Patescibacteria group bacterium]|nr:hypothetical protein [Patescibacteria group bacterium]MDD5121272.1 hypothetical protein [Patescibacteria group bacterium]MDD5221835.1 hypothetical protein [Patescibacteria group bacterium]MDD5395809.1 hypothetical protein [Patescibacteria group bacterium]